MIEPTRRGVLDCLARLSELAPEMRLSQLIACMADIVCVGAPISVWELEDDQLLEALRKFESDLLLREGSVM